MTFQKLTAFTKKVGDLADKPALTPTELKAQFDAAPDEVRQYLNALIDNLVAIGLNGSTTFTGDLNTLINSGFYYSGTGGTNRPGGNGFVRVEALDSNYITQMFVDAFDGKVYSRVCNGGTWQPWTQLATTTQENFTSLVLQNGWAVYQAGMEGVYYKDQLGRVHLSGRFKNGVSSDNTVLATIPSSYRPIKDHFFKARNCDLVVSPDGTLRVYNVTSPGDIGIDGISFRAV